MNRRSFLLAAAAPFARAEAVQRQVFLKSPGQGAAVMALAWYTRPRGGLMMSIEERWSRSDTIDVAFRRRSSDFGRTWTLPTQHKTDERTPQGVLRRHLRGGWVDPKTGRLLEFWMEGVLPTDDPLEGLRRWRIYYTVSSDGGLAHHGIQPVIHKGAEYDAEHWLPGVWHGKNCAMLGDRTSQPLGLADGSILLPVEVSPLAPDGTLYNPGGGYTYHDSLVLIGRWKGMRIEWEAGQPVQGDPSRSTRGMVEPTLGRLARNRLLMVMRGSNDRKPEIPSWRWISISRDGGRRWSEPVPWTYHDGASFYSPSSCSQLLHHSNGKLYWLGNITPSNARGNRPRYPFVMGEVDPDSVLLIRDSLRTIDDQQPGDDPALTLSNFYAREDRLTGGIALHMTRLFALPGGWKGDAMLYRIPV